MLLGSVSFLYFSLATRADCRFFSRYILAIHRGLGIDFRATRDWAITHHALNALIILVIDLLRKFILFSLSSSA